MLVRTPDKKGAVSMATISLVDIYPTLLEYCNVPKPDQPLDGNSFTSLLKDPQAEWNIPSFTSFGINYSSVRSEKYRYIQYPDGSEELYDHRNDPHEFTNIADNPEMEAVKQKLAKYIPESWAESTGGRLEVHRDFDVVKRKVNKYHNHYEKYMKEKEAKK
ncbi:MAG: DUF4976 domain-containing protein, partial [Bacteroidales bacterium]|nr:DUF4976 domain-containing protein [Bacteroidales bacterium]